MDKKKRLYILIGMALILASHTTAAFAMNEANNTSRTIETSVDRLQRQVRIAIKDSGPGIPQTEQAHIFEPFYRIDASRSRHQGGAGLGLTISDMIV
jgi:signal transduction histidine kinase